MEYGNITCIGLHSAFQRCYTNSLILLLVQARFKKRFQTLRRKKTKQLWQKQVVHLVQTSLYSSSDATISKFQLWNFDHPLQVDQRNRLIWEEFDLFNSTGFHTKHISCFFFQYFVTKSLRPHLSRCVEQKWWYGSISPDRSYVRQLRKYKILPNAHSTIPVFSSKKTRQTLPTALWTWGLSSFTKVIAFK